MHTGVYTKMSTEMPTKVEVFLFLCKNTPEGPHEDSHESAHGKFSSESELGQFSHVLSSYVLFLGLFKYPCSLWEDVERSSCSQNLPKGTNYSSNGHLMQHLHGTDVVVLLSGEGALDVRITLHQLFRITMQTSRITFHHFIFRICFCIFASWISTKILAKLFLRKFVGNVTSPLWGPNNTINLVIIASNNCQGIILRRHFKMISSYNSQGINCVIHKSAMVFMYSFKKCRVRGMVLKRERSFLWEGSWEEARSRACQRSSCHGCHYWHVLSGDS